ncbi:MAG TPA: efflux RND transporter permease subunit [Pirellulales bacterium]|jgi:multidrug efflux pump subunit AcrB|nr:efflux RND transporter permease subunit [Pirellulales bacterium]
MAFLLRVCVGASVVFALCASPIFSWSPLAFAGDAAISLPTDSPGITVEARYPGGTAQVVADLIAVPIETQINGVEKMRSMRSQSSSDGTYRLTITFESHADLDKAAGLVRNRIAIAIPTLPDSVRQYGITVRKTSPPPCAIVVISSSNGNALDALGAYAKSLTDELARLPGIGEVTVTGRDEKILTIRLDWDKLAAAKVTATDVLKVLKEQAIETRSEMPLRLVLQRDEDQERVEALVLKSDAEGHTVRFRDAARLERDISPPRSRASFNQMTAVLLAISVLPKAHPREVITAVQRKLEEERGTLKKGISMQVAFDFAANPESLPKSATPEYLRLDLQLSEKNSDHRNRDLIQHSSAALQKIPGVQDVLTVCGPPFTPQGNQASFLIKCSPTDRTPDNREEIMRQARLDVGQHNLKGRVRIYGVSSRIGFLQAGPDLNLRVEGRDDVGQDELRKETETIATALRKEPKLLDVWLSPSFHRIDETRFEIDRTAAKGIPLGEITGSLRFVDGSNPEAIKKAKICNAAGERISLNELVKVKTVREPALLERFNMHPVIEISANRAPETSPSEARKRWDAQLKEINPPAKIVLESPR